MVESRTRQLSCEPTAVADARHWCRNELARLLPAADVDPSISNVIDDVELIVSELVTNALAARSGAIAVTLTVLDGCVSVSVDDDADGRPTITFAADTDTHGRGLSIVTMLSEASGVRPSPIGKEVWATVPVRHLARH